jgi:hypothetical protein
MNCLYRPSCQGYGMRNFVEFDPRLASDLSAARTGPTLVEGELTDLVDAAASCRTTVSFVGRVSGSGTEPATSPR